MIRNSIVLMCAILLFAEAVPLAEGEDEKFKPKYATVLADRVNIRAGRGLNFEVIGQLGKNSQAVVIGRERGWYKIKLPKDAFCFVHKDYIDAGEVATDKLYVRAGAGTNFNILGTLRKGEKINILQEQAQWLRIGPPKNLAGWIKKDYLQLTKKKYIAQIFQLPLLSKKTKTQAQGTVDDLGNIINRPGRHKLVEGKKILYYLKSDNIDLNQYIYQKVWISGEPEDWEDSAYPVINVEEIDLR